MTGFCEPKNPGGIPIYAFTISDPATGQFLTQQAGLAGEPWTENATHNLAEYMAAIKAVEWLKEHTPVMNLIIYGDRHYVKSDSYLIRS